MAMTAERAGAALDYQRQQIQKKFQDMEQEVGIMLLKAEAQGKKIAELRASTLLVLTPETAVQLFNQYYLKKMGLATRANPTPLSLEMPWKDYFQFMIKNDDAISKFTKTLSEEDRGTLIDSQTMLGKYFSEKKKQALQAKAKPA